MSDLIRIGLISDTHSYLDPKVFSYFEKCDEIWHAGDFGNEEVSQQLADFKPLRAVWGNIDDKNIRILHPKDNIFEIGGLKIWMTHIGGFPPRYEPAIIRQMPLIKPDIFICGHSHILRVMPDKKNNLLYMNPGAAGKHGFHHMRTLLRFEIFEGKPQNLEVIELGKRA
jgi:putative phosphoesterase